MERNEASSLERPMARRAGSAVSSGAAPRVGEKFGLCRFPIIARRIYP